MGKEEFRERYNDALEQVKEKKKVPIHVAVRRGGPSFLHAVATELNPEGLLKLSYSEFDKLNRDLEDKISIAREHEGCERYYKEGYEEASRWQGVMSVNKRTSVQFAERAYYDNVYQHFDSREDLKKFIPNKFKDLSRLELISRMSCKVRPDIFKRLLEKTNDEEKYNNDDWGNNTVVVAIYCKGEDILF